MTFNIISDGDPGLASPVMQNFRHVNYGNALIPVTTLGAGVSATLDLGSSAFHWKDLYIGAINATGEIEDKNNYKFSVTGSVAGADISSIIVPDNTGLYIKVTGNGLKGAVISQYHAEFQVNRTTGVCTISQPRNESAFGGDTGGYISVVADGNNIKIKAYTDAGTWAAVGRVHLDPNNDLTIN